MSIIRPDPTSEERRDFQNIAVKEDTGKLKFEEQLAKAGQEAIKKGLPFADNPARNMFKDYYEQEAKANYRKNGYVNPSEIKPIKIDLNEFMDLKNFDLIEEGERSDEQLTKRNPGLDVKVGYKTYKFKGYSYIYMVMESATDAILRARKKLRELEADTPKKK
jgi:hypothetical protein